MACAVLAASLFFHIFIVRYNLLTFVISNLTNYTTVANICGPIHIDIAEIFIIEASLFLKVVIR